MLKVFTHRDIILRRLKQMLVVGFWLVIAAVIAFIALQTRHVWIGLGIDAIILLILLKRFFTAELQSISENYGFRLLPPGWGSLQPRTALGSGRFLSTLELVTKFRWKPGGILIGRLLPQQRPFGLLKNVWIGPQDDRHMLTVAGSRIGKGTAALIPNLLVYPGSALVLDPKGELTHITSSRRGCGSAKIRRCLNQQVFILDPEDVAREKPKSRWNPLAELDVNDPDLVSKVQKICFALIPPDPNSQDQFFINQSRDLLVMLILHVFSAEPPERHNLIQVRHLISQGDTELYQWVLNECHQSNQPSPFNDALETLLNYMAQNAAYGGKVAGFAQRLLSLPDDTRNTVIQDLYGRTSFLDLSGLEHMLEGSDFSLRELKLKPTTIYVCMKGSSLSTTMKPIASLLIEMAINAMEDEPYRPPHSVLFAMDEFSSLDRIESIDRAMGLIAGFQVKLWPVLQGIDQLQAKYPATWDNFIRNCGAVQYAGDQNPATVTEMEKRLGYIVTKMSDGRLERVPLIDESLLKAQYFQKESRRQLVFFNQEPAAPLEFIDYYDHGWLDSLAEDRPKPPANAQAQHQAWKLGGRSVKAVKGLPRP